MMAPSRRRSFRPQCDRRDRRRCSFGRTRSCCSSIRQAKSSDSVRYAHGSRTCILGPFDRRSIFVQGQSPHASSDRTGRLRHARRSKTSPIMPARHAVKRRYLRGLPASFKRSVRNIGFAQSLIETLANTAAFKVGFTAPHLLNMNFTARAPAEKFASTNHMRWQCAVPLAVNSGS